VAQKLALKGSARFCWNIPRNQTTVSCGKKSWRPSVNSAVSQLLSFNSQKLNLERNVSAKNPKLFKMFSEKRLLAGSLSHNNILK
jgi:hypothetical protein